MADANVAMTHFTIGAVVVAGLNWLKSSKYFPWITKEKATMLRIFSVMAAAAGAVGIHWTWNPEQHALTITGLTLAGITVAFYEWLKQFAVQEFMYQSTKKPPTEVTNVIASPAPSQMESFHLQPPPAPQPTP